MFFCIQINIKFLYKLILSFWMCVTRHAQSTQNKKFAYLCNISSKAWRMKLFFPANKHEGFLQVDSITFCLFSQACPKYSKESVYNIFVISQGKCEGWTWSFAYRLTSKVSLNCFYHFRCVCPSMLKLPKITSLLFLCNILRKNWVLKLIFCMQSFLKIIWTLGASKFPTRLILHY